MNYKSFSSLAKRWGCHFLCNSGSIESMKTRLILALLVALALSEMVFAQIPPPPGMHRPSPGSPMRDDPHRPVDQISRDLGVTPDQFRACFIHVTPAQQGSMPASHQKHANKQVLLSCLQKSNPNINNDSLDAVMDRYRPGGRAAQ